MKNYLLSLLLIGSLLPLQAQQTDDAQAIKDLVQNVFDDVWSGLDADKITEYQTEDFILLEHGEVWTNDTIANYCVRAAKRPNRGERINDFEFIEVKVIGDWAWAAYHNYGTFKTPGAEDRKRYWLESIVAIRTDDGWKLKMMHSTRGKAE